MKKTKKKKIPEVFKIKSISTFIKQHPTEKIAKLMKRDGIECKHCRATAVEVLFHYGCGKVKCKQKYINAINSDGQEVQLTLDHIIPASKGGVKILENLQILCNVCNTKKGNKYSNKKREFFVKIQVWIYKFTNRLNNRLLKWAYK